MIELRNSIDRNEITKNENPKKVVNIVEKIINFNKNQKDKGLKILTPKQMLQRLPIAPVQVKAGKITKWNQTNHIFLYQEKEVTKKVYNVIMNSIKL